MRGRKAKTFEQHVLDCRVTHGNKYEYLKLEGRKLHIVCPKHGVFIQDLGNHKRGHNCPECAKVTAYENRRAATLDSLRENLVDHVTLNNFDFETRTGYFTCDKHGTFTKRLHIIQGITNPCKCCYNEQKDIKKAFIKEYFLPDVIVAVKKYLKGFCIRSFMNLIHKATYIGDYTFTHQDGRTITLTLTDIKRITNEKTLF